MRLADITAWLDRALMPETFDDVSNNGLQIGRSGDEVRKVAFAVDASAEAIRAASAVGAQLLVVHHGISWGGGIRRIVDGEYAVVKAAMDADIALYASHLPLDANRKYGNNWEIARFLKLRRIRPAFSYHGNVIGVVGEATRTARVELGTAAAPLVKGETVGVCSGGAGEFAAEAKSLGCRLYVTGEASWGDVIAAQNAGASLVCCGHYETETFGVSALARAMAKDLDVKTVFVDSRRS